MMRRASMSREPEARDTSAALALVLEIFVGRALVLEIFVGRWAAVAAGPRRMKKRCQMMRVWLCSDCVRAVAPPWPFWASVSR